MKWWLSWFTWAIFTEGHDSCNSSRRNSSSPIRRTSNWEGPFSIHPTMSPSSPDLGTFTKNAKRLKSFDIQSTPILQRMSDAFGTLGRNTLQYRAHSDLFGDGSNSAGTWNPSKPKRASLDDFVETNATKAKTKKVKKRSLGDLGEMDPALVPKSRSGSTTSEVLVYNRHRRSGVALQEAADFEVHIWAKKYSVLWVVSLNLVTATVAKTLMQNGRNLVKLVIRLHWTI